MDTHPGLNEETLLSISISDVLILILRPDSQDYQGTAVTVDVSRKLQVPASGDGDQQEPPSRLTPERTQKQNRGHLQRRCGGGVAPLR